MNAIKSPMASDHEILTIKEICAVLQVHPSTVYRLARQRKIPSFRIDTDWRFRSDVIERRMTEESMGAPLTEGSVRHGIRFPSMAPVDPLAGLNRRRLTC
jgi:excisionase family DNA binding protein